MNNGYDLYEHFLNSYYHVKVLCALFAGNTRNIRTLLSYCVRYMKNS